MLPLKFNSQPECIVHASNPNTQEAEARRFYKFQAILGNLARLCLKIKSYVRGVAGDTVQWQFICLAFGQAKFYSQSLVARDSVISSLCVLLENVGIAPGRLVSLIFLYTWALWFLYLSSSTFSKQVVGLGEEKIASLWARCGKFIGFVAICSVTFPIFSVGQSVHLLSL